MNDQPQLGNADRGNNGLGHQSRELPSQAASHAAEDIPAVAAGEDANKGHAAHGHVPPRNTRRRSIRPTTTIADSDAPGLRGEPPGHVNDQPQLGNADPGNNGLGHQSRELPSQASAHAAKDIPASRQARTPTKTMRPMVRCRRGSTRRRSIRPRRRSRTATPRACEASPPGM